MFLSCRRIKNIMDIYGRSVNVELQQRSVECCDRMVVGFTTPMLSVPITTNIVSSNLTQWRCNQYNIM
jgi:hypothetical protein